MQKRSLMVKTEATPVNVGDEFVNLWTEFRAKWRIHVHGWDKFVYKIEIAAALPIMLWMIRHDPRSSTANPGQCERKRV